MSDPPTCTLDFRSWDRHDRISSQVKGGPVCLMQYSVLMPWLGEDSDLQSTHLECTRFATIPSSDSEDMMQTPWETTVLADVSCS